jgi:hypothetical protein
MERSESALLRLPEAVAVAVLGLAEVAVEQVEAEVCRKHGM